MDGVNTKLKWRNKTGNITYPTRALYNRPFRLSFPTTPPSSKYLLVGQTPKRKEGYTTGESIFLLNIRISSNLIHFQNPTPQRLAASAAALPRSIAAVGTAPEGPPALRGIVAGTIVVVGTIPEVNGASATATTPSKAGACVAAAGSGVAEILAGFRTLCNEKPVRTQQRQLPAFHDCVDM